MTPPAAPLPSPPRRWPLYASLFLNIVLLTALALGAWHAYVHWGPGGRDGWGREPDGMKPWMPHQIERFLPDSAREKVKAIRDEHAAQFKGLFATARDARNKVKAALDAEPFDAASLKTALASVRIADQAVSEAAADVIVEIASSLTPDERKAVRDKRQEMRDRSAKRRGKSVSSPDPDKKDGPPPDGPPPDGPPPDDGAPPPPPPADGDQPPPPQ